MTAWVFMVHPETNGTTRVPDSPDVIEHYQARGWEQRPMPAELDPDQPDKGWTVDQAKAADEAERLKGEALNEALKEKGLPRTGKADEKRARLAEAETTEGDKE